MGKKLTEAQIERYHRDGFADPIASADVPPGAPPVKFRRRVDPQAVLRAIGAARQGPAK
jgi:hypothetical protein